MNEVLGAVLGIKLSLQGMEAVLRGIQTVCRNLNLTRAQADMAAVGFRMLAGEAAFMSAALLKAGQDEALRLTLQGITGSAGVAASQIRFIRAESEKGLFDKDEIFKAVRAFDDTGASIKNLLPLAEALSIRGGGDLGSTARALATLDSGGLGRLGGLLRNAGVSVQALRDAGLHINDAFKISDGPARTLAALQKVLGADGTAGLLGGGFSAELKGTLASISELLVSIGNGLLPIATPVLSFLKEVIKSVTWLNDLTGGWASNILLAVGAFMAIQKVLPILEALVNWEKLVVFWQSALYLLNNPWAALVGGVEAFINVLKNLVNIEKIEAAVAAIRDALEGNYTALAVAGGIAAAVGAAWYFGPHSAETNNDPDSGRTMNNGPMKRSDWNNVFADTHRRVLRG